MWRTNLLIFSFGFSPHSPPLLPPPLLPFHCPFCLGPSGRVCYLGDVDANRRHIVDHMPPPQRANVLQDHRRVQTQGLAIIFTYACLFQILITLVYIDVRVFTTTGRDQLASFLSSLVSPDAQVDWLSAVAGFIWSPDVPE